MLSSTRGGFSTPINHHHQQSQQHQKFEFSKAASYLVNADEPISLNHSHNEDHGGFPNSIGEYGMGRLLGRGAFGSVYEVTEIRHKTPLNEFKYAIKIVQKNREKRTLKIILLLSLSHSHIYVFRLKRNQLKMKKWQRELEMKLPFTRN